jgi:ubiquinone/menaquinone biosynthesis C-methylase UbiE
MLAQLFDTACIVSPTLRRLLIRKWFHYLSHSDIEVIMPFMNLGYASLDPNDEPLNLLGRDAAHRYCIALYQHVAGAIDLHGREVLEVGSGRGGGASYVMRYLHPQSVTGVDIVQKAVHFCNTFYQIDGLRFLSGDAEALPFDDQSFDAVINIESSYGYGHIERFFGEVLRVLRPGGYFLYADYRGYEQIAALRQHLCNAGFRMLTDERIGKQVVKALDLDQERKSSLIEQKVPRFLRPSFHYFAASPGSQMYQALCSGAIDYHRFVLWKGAVPEQEKACCPQEAYVNDRMAIIRKALHGQIPAWKNRHSALHRPATG